jgi:exoribonuclease II
MSKFKHTCKYEQIDEYTFKCSICDKEKMPKELVNDLERQLAEARESHRLAEEGVKFWITKYNELKEKGDE